jgi:tripeptidyl-peptidase-1
MAVSQSTPTNYYYWNSPTDDWEGFLLDLANRVTSATPLVVSISYGSIERYFSTSYLRSFNIEALKLAAQGVTLIASSGDAGANYLYYDGRYFDCYYTPEFPASSPLVTAVGATQVQRSF